MICPVCKSNNIDSAKFCGGCGTPMGKAQSAASPPTALTNCPQGHVYSSVYKACPYCPQADRQAPPDLATRIEPMADPGAETLRTRIEPPPTVIQQQVKPASPATVIEPGPDMNRTGPVRRDYATVVDPGPMPERPPAPKPIPQRPSAPATVVEPIQPIRPSAPATVVEPIQSIRPSAPATVVEPIAVQPVAPVRPASPPPPPPVQPPPVPQQQSPQPQSPPQPPPPVQAQKPPQRRTVVVPGESETSRGRLVGWLVSFAANQDGIDYRVVAGRTVIGANPNCDVVIDDEAVSGTHASIVWRNGRCFVKDELSSNGTWLNDVEVVEPQPLKSYDTIRIGNVMLTFVSFDLNP